jgi:hypothetical protein
LLPTRAIKKVYEAQQATSPRSISSQILSLSASLQCKPSPDERLGFVTFTNSVRPSLCKFNFLVIGLAISVFVWGLQYKLSLYFPAHSVYHQVPEAKLISKREQPTHREGFLVASTKPPRHTAHGRFYPLTIFVGVLALPAIARPRQIKQERKKPWCGALSAKLNAFFFRPPPIYS